MPIDSNQSSHGNFTKSGINDTQRAMPEIQAVNSSSAKVVTMSNQRVSADVSKFNDPKHHGQLLRNNTNIMADETRDINMRSKIEHLK